GQPAPQPGAAIAGGAAGGRLADAVAATVVDTGGAGDGGVAADAGGAAGPGAEAGRGAAGSAPARRLPLRRATPGADAAGAGLAAARSLVQSRRHGAYAVAHGRQRPPPAAMADLQRCRTHQQQRAGRAVAADVDRAVACAGAHRGAGTAPANGVVAGRAIAA